ncbi:MAG TPA: hypothetical protein DD729_05850 [Rhodobacteraceae bacterium]|nr:hypothetical protein [Paracoccaceae bacterium]
MSKGPQVSGPFSFKKNTLAGVIAMSGKVSRNGLQDVSICYKDCIVKRVRNIYLKPVGYNAVRRDK